MDALLNNKQYRNPFFWSSGLLLLVLFFVRWLLLPKYDPTISPGLLKILAEVIESFGATLLVTILVGLFIFLVTPRVMKTAKVEVVEPKSIRGLLSAAASASTAWTFRGGMGRFTKAETLPLMAERARNSGVTRRIRLMLLDPQNARACKSYADYRNVASAGGRPLTEQSVRNQVLATILTALEIAGRERMVELQIYLLPIWSSFRVDFSDQYAIVTGEDPREPALRIDKGTPFYDSYARELEWAMKQCSLLSSTITQPTHASEIPTVLNELGMNLDLQAADLESIWSLSRDGPISMPGNKLSAVVANFNWEAIREHWNEILEEIRRVSLKVHPLGFIHSVIHREQDIALRIHIWESKSRVMQQPHWPIHTHVFDLQSTVIVGRVTNHTYSWLEGDSDPAHRLYEATLADGESRLTATGRLGNFTRTSSELINCGGSYAVARSVFHQTIVSQGAFAATLARTHNHPGNPLVAGEVNSKALYPFQRAELDAREKDRMVVELQNLISV
jgi:hypothetical protein